MAQQLADMGASCLRAPVNEGTAQRPHGLLLWPDPDSRAPCRARCAPAALQVSCKDRRGLLSDLIIALKQMPLEVRRAAPEAARPQAPPCCLDALVPAAARTAAARREAASSRVAPACLAAWRQPLQSARPNLG